MLGRLQCPGRESLAQEMRPGGLVIKAKGARIGAFADPLDKLDTGLPVNLASRGGQCPDHLRLGYPQGVGLAGHEGAYCQGNTRATSQKKLGQAHKHCAYDLAYPGRGKPLHHLLVSRLSGCPLVPAYLPG